MRKVLTLIFFLVFLIILNGVNAYDYYELYAGGDCEDDNIANYWDITTYGVGASPNPISLTRDSSSKTRGNYSCLYQSPDVGYREEWICIISEAEALRRGCNLGNCSFPYSGSDVNSWEKLVCVKDTPLQWGGKGYIFTTRDEWDGNRLLFATYGFISQYDDSDWAVPDRLWMYTGETLQGNEKFIIDLTVTDTSANWDRMARIKEPIGQLAAENVYQYADTTIKWENKNDYGYFKLVCGDDNTTTYDNFRLPLQSDTYSNGGDQDLYPWEYGYLAGQQKSHWLLHYKTLWRNDWRTDGNGARVFQYWDSYSNSILVIPANQTKGLLQAHLIVDIMSEHTGSPKYCQCQAKWGYYVGSTFHSCGNFSSAEDRSTIVYIDADLNFCGGEGHIYGFNGWGCSGGGGICQTRIDNLRVENAKIFDNICQSTDYSSDPECTFNNTYDLNQEKTLYCQLVDDQGNYYFPTAITIKNTEEEGNCSDGIKNANEQGIDCGGNCQPCSEKYGNCVPVIKNGDVKDKIDVVFVGSGFSDLSEFDWVVDKFVDYNESSIEPGLMAVEPFKNHKEMFNFWKVNTIQTFSSGFCIPGIQRWFPQYFFDAHNLAINECDFEYDYLNTFSVEPKVRSATSMESPQLFSPPKSRHQSFVTIGDEYLDNNFASFLTVTNVDCEETGSAGSRDDVVRTFLHEFGHSFGYLWDEYIDETGLAPLAWYIPNCDANGLLGEPACTKWDSIVEHGCEPGCFKNSWYRPYDDSLMRSINHDVDFEPVNEYFLEQKILDFNKLPLIESIFSILLDLNYSDGNITSSSAKIVYKKVSNKYSLDENGFNMKLLSDSNEIINDFNFNFMLSFVHAPLPQWFDENGGQVYFPEEQITTITDSNFSVLIPYENTAAKIDIYDKNSNYLMSIDISDINPVKYSLGFGGQKISNPDVNATYSITPAPVKQLYGIDYNIFIGPQFFFGN